METSVKENESIDLVLDVEAADLFGPPEGAIGWQALDSLLQQRLGESDFEFTDRTCESPVSAIYGYRRSEPNPHWLLVTFAFSELFGKESDDPDVSGWGYELTMRVAGDGESPPDEAVFLLGQIAEYVFDYGAALSAGTTLDLSQLLAGTEAEPMSFVALRADPELETGETPFGQLSFLQVVVSTQAEQTAMLDWSPTEVLELMAGRDALLVHGPNHVCLLQDEEIRQEIEQRITAEGSSGEMLALAERMSWSKPGLLRRQARLSLEAYAVEPLCRRLLGRIPFGRSLTLVSEDHEVQIEPADACEMLAKRDISILRLTEEACRELVNKLRGGEKHFACPGLEKLTIAVSEL